MVDFMKYLFIFTLLSFAQIALSDNLNGFIWEQSTAAIEEVDSSKLDLLDQIAFDDESTQALIITKNGKIVHEKYADGYDQKSPGTSWSVAKSFYAALVGISLENGEIESLDDPVAKYLPQFNDDRNSITL